MPLTSVRFLGAVHFPTDKFLSDLGETSPFLDSEIDPDLGSSAQLSSFGRQAIVRSHGLFRVSLGGSSTLAGVCGDVSFEEWAEVELCHGEVLCRWMIPAMTPFVTPRARARSAQLPGVERTWAMNFRS